MKTLIVIPARYESTRYPGKPLVKLTGADGKSQSLIERTWHAAMSVKGIDKVVVSTDDQRIQRACEIFGAEVVMTSRTCGNGTERCAETLVNLGGDYQIVVNLQGDAPLTPSWFVEDLVRGLNSDPSADIATPVLRCDGASLGGFWQDRREGRVGGTTAVFDANGRGLYFSKEVIPYTSEKYEPEQYTPVFHHVGVYAYRAGALLDYPTYKMGPLEKLEGLEQLRFLENARPVLCVQVEARGRQFWELNNPEDVPKLEKMLLEMGME